MSRIPVAKNWYTFDAAQVASVVLLLLGILLLVLGAPWSQGANPSWQSALLVGFSGNVVTGAVTAFVVDVITQRRMRQNQLRELIIDLRSGDPGISKRAVEELREEAWLNNGTLEGLDLSYIRLNGVKLENAKLNRANLTGARLERCNLRGCDLRGANLNAASIVNCDLSQADLTEASAPLSDWSHTDLRAATLTKATFQDSCFDGADLKDAITTGSQLPPSALVGT